MPMRCPNCGNRQIIVLPRPRINCHHYGWCGECEWTWALEGRSWLRVTSVPKWAKEVLDGIKRYQRDSSQ